MRLWDGSGEGSAVQFYVKTNSWELQPGPLCAPPAPHAAAHSPTWQHVVTSQEWTEEIHRLSAHSNGLHQQWSEGEQGSPRSVASPSVPRLSVSCVPVLHGKQAGYLVCP